MEKNEKVIDNETSKKDKNTFKIFLSLIARILMIFTFTITVFMLFDRPIELNGFSERVINTETSLKNISSNGIVINEKNISAILILLLVFFISFAIYILVRKHKKDIFMLGLCIYSAAIIFIPMMLGSSVVLLLLGFGFLFSIEFPLMVPIKVAIDLVSQLWGMFAISIIVCISSYISYIKSLKWYIKS